MFPFHLDPNISDKKITLQMIYCKQRKLIWCAYFHSTVIIGSHVAINIAIKIAIDIVNLFWMMTHLIYFLLLCTFDISLAFLQAAETRWMFGGRVLWPAIKCIANSRDFSCEWRHWVVCAIGLCLHHFTKKLNQKSQSKRKAKYFS